MTSKYIHETTGHVNILCPMMCTY